MNINLFIINETILDLEIFTNSLLETTKYITYSRLTSLNEINNNIEVLELSLIDNLIFVFCNKNNDDEYIGNHSIFDIEFNKLLSEIISKYKIKNIDFLACNLLSQNRYINYFNYLQEKNNISIRATDKLIGNGNN